MRTKEQYIERLSKMKRNLFISGERIGRGDERFIPSYNVMGKTFELAQTTPCMKGKSDPAASINSLSKYGDG